MKTRLFRKGFFSRLVDYLISLFNPSGVVIIPSNPNDSIEIMSGLSSKRMTMTKDRDETVELRPYVDFRVQDDE